MNEGDYPPIHYIRKIQKKNRMFQSKNTGYEKSVFLVIIDGILIRRQVPDSRLPAL
jgi:hypothetical protein